LKVGVLFCVWVKGVFFDGDFPCRLMVVGNKLAQSFEEVGMKGADFGVGVNGQGGDTKFFLEVDEKT